ncbi:MAG: hypothetical protein ACPIOQ_74020, partial [Promethearchaeia archaeon]
MQASAVTAPVRCVCHRAFCVKAATRSRIYQVEPWWPEDPQGGLKQSWSRDQQNQTIRDERTIGPQVP